MTTTQHTATLGTLTLEPAGDAGKYIVARRDRGTVTRTRPLSLTSARRVMRALSRVAQVTQ